MISKAWGREEGGEGREGHRRRERRERYEERKKSAGKRERGCIGNKRKRGDVLIEEN